MARFGNLVPVAKDATEMFGGAAAVCVGYPGDGLWTNLGFIMNVSITRSLFSQTLKNEVMQTPGTANFQVYYGGAVNLTLRRFQVEQMAGLYPNVVKEFAASTGQGAGMGHILTPRLAVPPGLHIRPIDAYGVPANNGNVWWIPAVVPGEELGEFIYKIENSREAQEDFTLTFEQAFITEDYTPGAPQSIDESGQMFFRGDTTHIVTSTWEKNLPFGYVLGTPGRPESISASAVMDTTLSIDWTAPGAAFVADGYPVTSYRVSRRVVGNGAFMDVMHSDLSDLSEDITGLTASTTYEFRVTAISSAGEGQQAQLMVTTAA